MFEFSLPEILVVFIVGTLVIGPDDLPLLAANLRKFLRSLRAMREEFRAGVAEISGEAGAEEVEQTLAGGRRFLVDESGKLQEIFDISDFLEEKIYERPASETDR